MKGLGILIGVIAVVAILGGLYVSGFFNSSYFETKTVFGGWGQDIRVIYEDGTSESLSMLMNRPLSTLTYGGKAIYGFEYGLNAKATGTGYTDAKINIISYSVIANIKSGSTVKVTQTQNWLAQTFTIPLDSAFHSLGGIFSVAAKSKMDPLGLPAGTYTMEFIPTGSITYQGNPGGTVSTATLPSAVSFSIVYSAGTLSVVVENGVTQW